MASSEQIKSHIFSLEHKIFSGQGKGGTGKTFAGGVDVLKFFEKQKLSSIALEAVDEADVPSLSKSVGIKLVFSLRLLTAFPKSLVEGLRVLKNLFLDKLSAFVTTFLNFLYFGKKDGHDLDCLKSVFLLFMS